MEALSKVLDFVGKYAWAVCVTAAFVLLIPEDAAKQIGLSELRSVYKGPLWIVLVLTLVVALGAAFQYIDHRVIDGWLKGRRDARVRQEERLIEEKKRVETEQQQHLKQEEVRRHDLETLALRLRSLDPNERMWIKYCLYHNVQTLSAERGNRTAQSLSNKNILAEGSGQIFDLPFHIPDHVWKYLLQNQDEFLTETDRGDKRFPAALESYRKSLWAHY